MGIVNACAPPRRRLVTSTSAEGDRRADNVRCIRGQNQMPPGQSHYREGVFSKSRRPQSEVNRQPRIRNTIRMRSIELDKCSHPGYGTSPHWSTAWPLAISG